MDVQIVAAIISAAVAATIGIMTWFNERANFRSQQLTERRRSIAKMLNEFYGPLIAYLGITDSLHEILIKDKPRGFRTLTYLIDPDQTYEINGRKTKVSLTESDQEVLKRIIEVEERIEELIILKGGLVDDPRLMFCSSPDKLSRGKGITSFNSTSLSSLIAHFHLLRLANQGKLEGEIESSFPK